MQLWKLSVSYKHSVDIGYSHMGDRQWQHLMFFVTRKIDSNIRTSFQQLFVFIKE